MHFGRPLSECNSGNNFGCIIWLHILGAFLRWSLGCQFLVCIYTVHFVFAFWMLISSSQFVYACWLRIRSLHYAHVFYVRILCVKVEGAF